MQRAAAGLAAAVARPARARLRRAGCVLLVGAGDNGGDALYAGALLARRGCAVEALLLVASRSTRAGSAALRGRRAGRSTERPSTRLERRPDVVVDGIVGIGGRPGLRPEAVAALDAPRRACPSSRSTCRAGSTSTPASSTGPHVRADVTVTFGTHKVAHLVDPAARRLRRGPPRRHRPRPRPSPPSRRCSPTTSRRLLPRPGRRRAQVHPRRGRRPRRLGDLPRRRRALRRRRGLRAGRAWCATSGRRRRRRAACAAAAPGGRRGDGRVQAWVVGPGRRRRRRRTMLAGGARRRRARRRRRRRARPTSTAPLAGARRAHPARRRARRDCSAPTASEVEAGPLRHARAAAERTTPWCCSRAATRSSPAPTATRPGDHHRRCRGWPPPAPATCSPG